MLARDQAERGTQLTAVLALTRIADRRDQGGRRHWRRGNNSLHHIGIHRHDDATGHGKALGRHARLANIVSSGALAAKL